MTASVIIDTKRARVKGFMLLDVRSQTISEGGEGRHQPQRRIPFGHAQDRLPTGQTIATWGDEHPAEREALLSGEEANRRGWCSPPPPTGGGSGPRDLVEAAGRPTGGGSRTVGAGRFPGQVAGAVVAAEPSWRLRPDGPAQGPRPDGVAGKGPATRLLAAEDELWRGA